MLGHIIQNFSHSKHNPLHILSKDCMSVLENGLWELTSIIL